MSNENETQQPAAAESAVPESQETGATETTEKDGGNSQLADLTSGSKGGDDDSAWFGDGDSKGSESETESSESSSESESETETSSAAPVSDIADVKKLIKEQGQIPEGTDENLIKAARAELLYEEAQAETAKLRSYLNQNPAELFTEEQKAELKEILDTKGEDAWYDRRKQMEQEVVEKRLNDPAFKENSQAVSNQSTYAKFLTENKINHENFVNARLQVDVDAFNKKEITLDEFLKRTKASYDRMTKNIHKGDTPPKIVKGTSSKTGTPAEKDVWYGD